MSLEAKIKFFDGIADKWDSWEDVDSVVQKLVVGLNAFGVHCDESVLDVGCGTGNLTRAILAKLSPNGHVTAIDISDAMLIKARTKVSDPRVAWHQANATHIPVDAESFDRIICFSVWPHLHEPDVVAAEFYRVLRPGGWLHIWHLASRTTINAIHASAGPAVAHDVLVPATQTAHLLAAHGFAPAEIVDDDINYRVSAQKLGSSR